MTFTTTPLRFEAGFHLFVERVTLINVPLSKRPNGTDLLLLLVALESVEFVVKPLFCVLSQRGHYVVFASYIIITP